MADQALVVKSEMNKTKVESFLAKKGRIVVKVYHTVGGVQALYNSSIELTTLRFFEPGNEQNCTEGVQVEIKQAGRIEQTHTSFLDMDEVEGLVQGLEYMGGLVAQCQGYHGDYTEVIFSTRGDLSVGFYVQDGKLQSFAKSGICSVYFPPASLHLLRSLLMKGATHLASTPIAGAGGV